MSSQEEREAAELLGSLGTDPPGPSRVDVPETMRAGARRRNRRVATGVAFSAVAVVSLSGGAWALAAQRAPDAPAPAASASPSAPPAPKAKAMSCAVTRLPTGAVKKAVVSAIDPSGRWQTGRIYPEGREFGTYPVTIWKDGKLATTVDFPGADQSLNAINSSGDAVGSSFDDADRQIPYAWHDGKLTELKGGAGDARAVSDAGIIVGVLGERPARWASYLADPELLPLPPGATRGAAVDVDEDGTVLLAVGPELGPDHNDTGYLLLPGGEIRELPQVTVDIYGGARHRSQYIWPVSLRNGWVTGTARYDDDSDGSTSWSGYRYRLSTGKAEQLPASVQSPAAIAANGWVVAEGGKTGVTMLAEGREIGLAGYKAGKSYNQDMMYQLRGISDDGRTIVGTWVPPGEDLTNEPLLWRCE